MRGELPLSPSYAAGDIIDLEVVVGLVGQTNSTRYEGWTVTACRTPFCLEPAGTPQVTDENGRATYPVGTGQVGFDGHLEVTSDEQPGVTYVQRWDDPLDDFSLYDLGVDPVGLSASIFEDETGRPLPESYGVAVLVSNRDCHLWAPAGMTLEVSPSEGVNTVYFFSDEAGTAPENNVIGVAGPAGDYIFVLRDRTGRETRRLEVELSPARYQVLVTLPSPL